MKVFLQNRILGHLLEQLCVLLSGYHYWLPGLVYHLGLVGGVLCHVVDHNMFSVSLSSVCSIDERYLHVHVGMATEV